MDAASRTEVVPNEVLVEKISAHPLFRREQLQLLARHEGEERALARAHGAIALEPLVELALYFELDAAAMAAAGVFHLLVATASLAPSMTKIAPVIRSTVPTRRSLARSQFVPRLASNATATLTSVPWTLKSSPSNRICGTGGPAARSTNCGRNGE